MNAAGTLGHRNPLHTVHATFELEPGVSALTFDAHNDFFVPAESGGIGAHHLHAPAARLGIAGIHAEKLGGEERCFVAARASTDFHDDVLGVVGILWKDKHLQPLFEFFFALAQRDNFFFCQLANRFVGLVEELSIPMDFLLHFAPVAKTMNDLLQLGAFFGELGVFSLLAEELGIGHPLFQLNVALFNFS